MDDGFRTYLETLHASFEKLVSMEPHTVLALPQIVPLECIYLFTENSRPLYVGRTRKLRQRLRNHCGSASGHNQAVFAFKLAREATGRMKAGYSKHDSREVLIANADFSSAFVAAKARIRRMELRFVEEKDPLSQALLEIYASYVLRTPYNDFETH